MTTSTSAFGRANAFVHRRWLGHLRPNSKPASAAQAAATASKAAEGAHQRELFLNVLNANATKRDAKQYLARFKQTPLHAAKDSSAPRTLSAQRQRATSRRTPFLGPTRAIAEDPQFKHSSPVSERLVPARETIHVALVCVRDPQSMNDSTLKGVALTLAQLVQLDMRIAVVLDCQRSSREFEHVSTSAKDVVRSFARQGERLIAAINRHSPEGARTAHGAFEVVSAPTSTTKTRIAVPNLILSPLEGATVPVFSTIAHTESGQLRSCSASSIMVALTRFLSGLSTKRSLLSASEISLDRIILLDPFGGIPSMVRDDDAHVFINLQQEFAIIKDELTEYSQLRTGQGGRLDGVFEQHITNLQMVQECLSMLPSCSSALIITPEEAAASSSQTMPSPEHPSGAGTRRQKNTLIHNLLTNKPIVSPSLPVARLPTTAPCITDSDLSRQAPQSTLVKRGMPLTIVPTVLRGEGWRAPVMGESTIDLEHDPRVDLARLVHLIEDSFRRKLDVRHYLSRIRGRTAGLIVAGSYDGGAILTWEQPPGTSDPSRLVPYLDKFAVLSSSQGSTGVADVLFQAMVRTCFPGGVCWRSRKDNPVNKWYFERADGHWQIPGTNWTMFWTGVGLVDSQQRWDDYVAVCSNIEASWMDGKRPG